MKTVLFYIVAVYCFFVSSFSWACTVCFKDPDSAMVKGANSGVLLLLGVIVFVLICFASLIFYFRKRAQKVLR